MGQEIKESDVVPQLQCKEITWKISGNRVLDIFKCISGVKGEGDD